eukprot:6168467-Amphidinium_carterae.2
MAEERVAKVSCECCRYNTLGFPRTVLSPSLMSVLGLSAIPRRDMTRHRCREQKFAAKRVDRQRDVMLLRSEGKGKGWR